MTSSDSSEEDRQHRQIDLHVPVSHEAVMEAEGDLLLGWTLYENRDLDEAREFSRSALERIMSVLEPEDTADGGSQGRLELSEDSRSALWSCAASALELTGVIEADCSRQEESREAFARAATIRKRECGDRLGARVTFLQRGGPGLLLHGDARSAREALESALLPPSLDESSQVAVACVFARLGDTLRKLGRLDLAEHFLMKSLTMKRRLLQPVHKEIATSLHFIARLYADQGDNGKARKMYELAIDMSRRTLPEGHPELVERTRELSRLGRS